MREYIIADNQDISKAGMMFLLSKQKDVATLLEADNKAELIQQLRLYPQAVVVLDYTLFDFAGADELIVLQERFKEVDWILFSDELSINFLRQVLFSSMAFGVVMKDNSKEEIMTAIQCAGRKQRYICNHVSNLLLSGAASPVAGTMTEDHLLTQTEKNILKEIALGKTTKEIAAEKNLSFHTINSHRKNIFRKLGVNNVHEATKYAMRAGIVDLAEYYLIGFQNELFILQSLYGLLISCHVLHLFFGTEFSSFRISLSFSFCAACCCVTFLCIHHRACTY